MEILNEVRVYWSTSPVTCTSYIWCITWKWPRWPILVVKYTIFLIRTKNSVCCCWRITSIYFMYCLNGTFRVKKTHSQNTVKFYCHFDSNSQNNYSNLQRHCVCWWEFSVINISWWILSIKLMQSSLQNL